MSDSVVFDCVGWVERNETHRHHAAVMMGFAIAQPILPADEFKALRSQIATSNEGWSQTATTSPGRGGRRHLPYAFTEFGAILLSLPMTVAVGAGSPAIGGGIASKLAPTIKVSSHDQALAGVIDAIRRLTAPPQPKKRPIGFIADPEDHA